MKIILVKPKFNTHLITPVPGLGYISSVLKKHAHDVKLIDALRDNLSNTEVTQIADSEKPDAVFVSVLSLYFEEAVDLCKKLKASGHKCIVGGVHATFEPYETLLRTCCDYVICGEGEIACVQLAQNGFINNGIKGVYSLADFTSSSDSYEFAEQVDDLDSLPFPDWEQINPNLYPTAPHGVIVKKPPVGIIMCSRGCPYSCSFCSAANLFSSNVRFRSPENVIDEIIYLKNTYNIHEIQFIDDNLTLRKNYIEKLCNLITEKKLNILWSCPNGVRADSIDKNIALLMKKAGCYLLTIGVESSDNEILKRINKCETIEVISNAIDSAHEVGLMTCGNFILGLPGDTAETINNTIKFACDSNLDLAQFSLLRVLPGSNLYNIFKSKCDRTYNKSSFSESDWIPEGLTKDELISLQGKAFRSFCLSPKRFFKLISSIRFSQIKYLLHRLKEYHFWKI